MACAYVQPSLPWKAIVSVAFLLGVPIKFWNGQPRETSSRKHSHVTDVRRNAPISLLFRAIVHRVSRFPNDGDFHCGWNSIWSDCLVWTKFLQSYLRAGCTVCLLSLIHIYLEFHMAIVLAMITEWEDVGVFITVKISRRSETGKPDGLRPKK